MAYPSTLPYERTDAEYNDQLLSWNRPDSAFFASGACHILAWTFVDTYPEMGFEIVHISPLAPFSRGHHVYATNGEWAFDFAGWTKENELLSATRNAYSNAIPGWKSERVVINTDLATFCSENNHLLPRQFAYSPLPRAANYLTEFEPPEIFLSAHQ